VAPWNVLLLHGGTVQCFKIWEPLACLESETSYLPKILKILIWGNLRFVSSFNISIFLIESSPKRRSPSANVMVLYLMKWVYECFWKSYLFNPKGRRKERSWCYTLHALKPTLLHLFSFFHITIIWHITWLTKRDERERYIK